MLSQSQVVHKKPMLHKQSTSLINPPSKKPSAEKKNIDNLDVTTTLPAAGLFTSGFNANGCPEGSGPTNRVGRKILMKSFFMRFAYKPATGESGQARILVVYDKQSNGSNTVPLNTEVLTGTAPDIISFQNLSNSERFVVIADVLTEQTSTNGASVIGEIYRKLNLDTIYGPFANPGQIGEIRTGAVNIYVCGSDPTIGSFTFSTRIRFFDQ